ncbi:MAG: sulfur carrier protein ThiS [Myxococcota bacterium]
MTEITLNGEPYTLEPLTTIAALIQDLGVAPDGVAVAVNLQVVPRSNHGQHVLESGDRVDVIRAVGGG